MLLFLTAMSAVQRYTEEISRNPQDHLAFNNRGHAHLEAKNNAVRNSMQSAASDPCAPLALFSPFCILVFSLLVDVLFCCDCPSHVPVLSSSVHNLNRRPLRTSRRPSPSTPATPPTTSIAAPHTAPPVSTSRRSPTSPRRYVCCSLVFPPPPASGPIAAACALTLHRSS